MFLSGKKKAMVLLGLLTLVMCTAKESEKISRNLSTSRAKPGGARRSRPRTVPVPGGSDMIVEDEGNLICDFDFSEDTVRGAFLGAVSLAVGLIEAPFILGAVILLTGATSLVSGLLSCQNGQFTRRAFTEFLDLIGVNIVGDELHDVMNNIIRLNERLFLTMAFFARGNEEELNIRKEAIATLYIDALNIGNAGDFIYRGGESVGMLGITLATEQLRLITVTEGRVECGIRVDEYLTHIEDLKNELEQRRGDINQRDDVLLERCANEDNRCPPQAEQDGRCTPCCSLQLGSCKECQIDFDRTGTFPGPPPPPRCCDGDFDLIAGECDFNPIGELSVQKSYAETICYDRVRAEECSFIIFCSLVRQLCETNANNAQVNRRAQLRRSVRANFIEDWENQVSIWFNGNGKNMTGVKFYLDQVLHLISATNDREILVQSCNTSWKPGDSVAATIVTVHQDKRFEVLCSEFDRFVFDTTSPDGGQAIRQCRRGLEGPVWEGMVEIDIITEDGKVVLRPSVMDDALDIKEGDGIMMRSDYFDCIDFEESPRELSNDESCNARDMSIS